MSTAAWGTLRNGLRRRLGSLWRQTARLSGRTPRRLRLCESLQLGERRFVAVVEFEEARFLVGGTPSSLVLLSRLEASAEAIHRDGMEGSTLYEEWAASIESRPIAKC